MSENVKQSNTGLIILGMLLAVSISLAGYFIGNTVYKAKIAAKTATVKGLATRTVEADKADWRITFSAEAYEQKAAYDLVDSQKGEVVAFLKASGFAASEYSKPLINVSASKIYNNQGIATGTRYYANASVRVVTADIQKVVKARYGVSKLASKGINLGSVNPEYIFTKLNDIKPEMLKEATQNARLAAQQFAEDAGVEVGGISRAAQGSFVIRDEGKEYGNRNEIKKQVRVVTTITFFLK